MLRVLKHIDVLNHDQAAVDHLPEYRQDPVDPIGAIDDLDPFREILGEPQQV